MTDRSALPRYRSALRRSDTRRGLFRAVDATPPGGWRSACSVDDVLDLTPVLADSTEKRGYPPHDPRLTVRLWTGSRS